MSKQKYKCGKCGHTECAEQLRRVKVTVGWDQLAMSGIAPCRMCTKCGDITVGYVFEFGEYVDLVPAEAAMKAARGGSHVPPPPPPKKASKATTVAKRAPRKKAAKKRAKR